MTVDYRSLFVRMQRGVPNHLTPTHILGPPRITSTGSLDTSSFCSIWSPGRRNIGRLSHYNYGTSPFRSTALTPSLVPISTKLQGPKPLEKLPVATARVAAVSYLS